MEIKELTETIHKFEQEHNVNSWKINGVRVWPVIRYLILIKYKRALQQLSSPGIQQDKKLSLIEKLRYLYIAFRHRLKFRAELNKWSGPGQVNVVGFSRYSDYHDKMSGKDYNKLIDPYLDYCERKNISCLKVELKDERPLNRFRAPLFIDDHDFRISYRSFERIAPKNDTDSFSAEINKISEQTSLPVHPAEVATMVQGIIYYRELFLKLLRRIKPSYVFLSGYYSNDTYGMILACKKMNIKTIDVQHGKQGQFHPMYSHWSRIPENGYELLPDYFWNWGEESRVNIQTWMNGKEIYHTPVVGGNLWLSMWRHKEVSIGERGDELLNKLKGYKKVVMASLQPIEDALPDFVMQAISLTPEWLWLVRLHPAMKGNQSVITKIKSLPNAEVDLSTDLPLYFLLPHIDAHVTAWSSVCFEALSFGKGTVLYHPNGEKTFNRQIEKGVFAVAYTSNEIIDKLKAFDKDINDSGYIETSKQVIDQGFNAIFSNAS